MATSSGNDLALNILISISSVIAIQWGMKRNIETQSAIQRVTPPDTRESQELGPAVEVETPKPRSRLARLMPNQAQWYLLGQFAVMGLAGFLLPRYGTTLITDIIWGTFEACLLTFVYQRSMSSLFPVPTVLRYRYPKNPGFDRFVLEESAEEDISYFQRDSPRLGLAILCALITLATLATGYHNALAVVSTAWILSGMTGFVGPIMSIRGCAALLITFQVVNGLALAVFAICQHFYPPDTSSPKETTKWVTPSPWLSELMTVGMWPFMTLLPASLICLTNRFEHFSRELPAVFTAPGAHLSIERTWPFLAKQSWRSATSAGLLSYTMGLLVHVSLVQLYKNDKALLDRVMGCSLYTTTVPTIMGISLAVYFQGRWSDWWGYYEQWPKIESQDVHYHDNDRKYSIMLPTESQITEGKQHSVNAL